MTESSGDVVVERPQQRTLRAIAWVLFTVLCLMFFVLIKIPQAKVTLTLLANINQQLEPAGYSLSADRGDLGMLWGVNYTLSGVKITKNDTGRSLSFAKLRISPAFIPLFSGKIGADILLEEGEGKVSGHVVTQKQEIEADVTIDALNLGRIGLIPFLTDFDGSAEAKGTFTLAKGAGTVKLELSKLVFDEAKIQGFAIPRIAVTGGSVDLDFDPKKVNIRKFSLGKSSPSDDLNLSATGDVKLSPQFENSDLNVHTKLSLSPKLLQSFSLIDAFLGAMKQPDGSYKFKLQGPVMGAMPLPDA